MQKAMSLKYEPSSKPLHKPNNLSHSKRAVCMVIAAAADIFTYDQQAASTLEIEVP